MTEPGGQRVRAAVAVLGVLLVAANLRPAVVGIAPLLGTIRSATGLSAGAAGLLTTLPLLCFGIFAAVAPVLARRGGLERTVAASLVLLAVGCGLRLLHPLAFLYGGTLLAGTAIAIGNVLMPAFVKRDFAHRVGLMMGAYTGMLNAGAAAAAGLTVPLMHAVGFGWRDGLAMWAVLPVLALAVWVFVPWRPARPADRAPTTSGFALLRHPVGRQATLHLGMQSLEFYSFAAWFPTLLVDQGVDRGRAGTLLAIANLVGAFSAILIGTIAGRRRDQRPLVLIVSSGYLLALLGLLLGPTSLAVVCAMLFGFAQGGGFGLGLTLVVLRTPTPAMAAGLSSVAQCLGYVVASTGPFALGAIHDATGSWTVPLLVLLGLLVPLVRAGLGAARDRVIPAAGPDCVAAADPGMAPPQQPPEGARRP